MNLTGNLLWPQGLPLLLLAPLAGLLLWACDRARARSLARTIGPRTAALAGDLGTGRRRMKRLLFAAALLLALGAFLQPSWGEAPPRHAPGGIDIVVCLDVSRSMLARDVAPSRLARARRGIRSLAERAAGERMALVLFAGEARVEVPLTSDLASLAEMAERADPLSIERGGTDLGAALTAAIDALEGRRGEYAAILLLTDGEDHEGRGLRAARACADRRITVHCIGFGSPLGGKIPVEGEAGETFLRDASGAEVVSAMDPAALRRIAAAAGGEFLEEEAEPRALSGLYENRILPMARERVEASERRERESRFQWALLPAFLLWMVESCLGERRRR